ncbi:MAG: hypothetical protein DRR42_08805 [Gammaproteobacteria bacterium]|nr:MAG: hypothetical protein DRR42_08805 [Gammaproteobacteria bacterium]
MLKFNFNGWMRGGAPGWQVSGLALKHSESEARMDTRFTKNGLRFEQMEGKFLLMYWMQGLTIACVVIPSIRDFLG